MRKVETERRDGRGADCLRFIQLVATAVHRSYISAYAAGTLHAQQRLCNGRLSRRLTAAAAACGWFAAERAAPAADRSTAGTLSSKCG